MAVNSKRNATITEAISTYLLEKISSPENIEEDTLYWELTEESNVDATVFKLEQICKILGIDKVDLYVKKRMEGDTKVEFDPVVQLKEPITQNEYLPFLTGYDATTPVQTYYSTQNVWYMDKYSEAQLQELMKKGATIRYKGKKYSSKSTETDRNKLKYEYIINLNDPVYGWLYTVYENLNKIKNGDKEAVKRVIKTKLMNRQKRYINADILKNTPEDFLERCGTVIGRNYKKGGFSDMYISEEHCEMILNRVLGPKGYTMITSPLMDIEFPIELNQSEIEGWEYNLKTKTKSVPVNDKGELQKPASTTEVRTAGRATGPVKKTGNNDVKSVKTGQVRTEMRTLTCNMFKVVRGIYLDVLGNFRIGQLVVAPSFVDSKATTTADELLKKNLMKSVWPVFASISMNEGTEWKEYLERQTEMEKIYGKKYKDLDLIVLNRIVPIDNLLEDIDEERKRIGGGEMRVGMIEGKRSDMEHVKMIEPAEEQEKKEGEGEGQEDVQEVATQIPERIEEGQREEEENNELDAAFEGL